MATLYTARAPARTKIIRKTKAGKKLNININNNKKKEKRKNRGRLNPRRPPPLSLPFLSDGARSYLLNPGPSEPRPPFRMQIEIRKRFRSFFRSSRLRPAGGRRGFSRARFFPFSSTSSSFLQPPPIRFLCPYSFSPTPRGRRHFPARAH